MIFQYYISTSTSAISCSLHWLHVSSSITYISSLISIYQPTCTICSGTKLLLSSSHITSSHSFFSRAAGFLHCYQNRQHSLVIFLVLSMLCSASDMSVDPTQLPSGMESPNHKMFLTLAQLCRLFIAPLTMQIIDVLSMSLPLEYTFNFYSLFCVTSQT